MQTQSSRASGSAILDTPPPSPNERVFSKPTDPGDDTLSLMGEPDSELGGNPALQGPGGKLILAVSMFMQAVNLSESITPGFVPEPVKQWIAMAMQQAPLLAQQMSRQSDPMAMLSAIGQNGVAQGASPMGMPAMGMAGGAGPGGSPNPNVPPPRGM